MRGTRGVLRKMATVINTQGLHTGEQFAHHGPMDKLDICALAYIVAEDCPPPAEFFTDEVASIRLIECSAGAMQAIKAISAVLDNEPCTTEIAPGHEVPDYIEHVSNWAMTPPIFCDRPPSLSEVIGRILRAADACEAARCICDPAPVYNGWAGYSHSAGCPITDEQQFASQMGTPPRPGFTDARGRCLTCGGHGSVTGDEIPYAELRPRQQQGHDHGRRYHRSKPCPDCDGQDRVTDAAVSAYESDHAA